MEAYDIVEVLRAGKGVFPVTGTDVAFMDSREGNAEE